MLGEILNKKQRIKDFFADSAKGFLLIWKYGRKLAIINSCLFLLQAVLSLLSLGILKNLIDLVMRAGANLQQYGINLLFFAAAQLAAFFVTQLSDYYLSIQQQIISDNIAGQVLNKAIELPLQYYETPSFYDQLHMVQQQSFSRPAQFIAACQGIVQNLAVVVLFSASMLTAHWSVLILIVVLGIPLAISKLIHGYKQFKLDRECMPAQRQAGDLFSYLTTYTYAKEVRMFGFGSDFIARFLHLKKFLFTKKKELHYRFLRQNLIIQLFEILVITAIYWIIIRSAVVGAITIGGLVIYFQVFQRLQAAINSLFQSGISLFQNQLYLREILKYLSAPVAAGEPAGNSPEYLQQGISVRELNFTYPLTERQVLRDIKMDFKPGKITAIVGENGSGKSTLMKLLCKLYDANKDTILINGVDITNITGMDLRNNITAVFQDFGKYYLTIEDNITLGSVKKNRSFLDEAADKAGILGKIKTFPDAYNTHLGRTFKNGEQLSGGQWQKIALARGFYRKSNILLLDEPTSSLDPVAEDRIFQNLKADMNDRIVVLITHRLYNLKIADHIYVMEDGAVAESGTFSELLSANGPFARMYEKQAI
jgi:ATP-binding cassette, subfamily B, bacterial